MSGTPTKYPPNEAALEQESNQLSTIYGSLLSKAFAATSISALDFSALTDFFKRAASLDHSVIGDPAFAQIPFMSSLPSPYPNTLQGESDYFTNVVIPETSKLQTDLPNLIQNLGSLGAFETTQEKYLSILRSAAPYVANVVAPAPSLFTTGNDTVDFNNLTADQLTVVKSGAVLNNSLGGNDIVKLPNEATVSTISVLSLLNSQTFFTGNGSSTITAGDGTYTIAGVESVDAKGGTNETGNKSITGTAGDVTVLFPDDVTTYTIGYNSLSDIAVNVRFSLVISSKDGENKDTLVGVNTIDFNTPKGIDSYDASTFENLAITKFAFDSISVVAKGLAYAAGPEAAFISPWISGLSNLIYTGVVAYNEHDACKSLFTSAISLLVDTYVDTAIDAVVPEGTSAALAVSKALFKTSVDKIIDPAISQIKTNAALIYDGLFNTESGANAPKGGALQEDILKKLEPSLQTALNAEETAIDAADSDINELAPNNEPSTVALPPPSPDPIPAPFILQGSSSQYTVVNNNGALLVQDSVSGRDGTQTIPTKEMTFTNGAGVFDPTGSAEDVARLYGAALARAPDVAGLESWSSQIDNSHVPLSQIAAGFVNSPEFIKTYGTLNDSAFVNQLYQNVLGRPADTAGATYWDGVLASGTSRGTVLVGFAESQENKANTVSTAGDVNTAEAYRLYRAALNRAPDATGLSYWTSTLNAGTTPNQVAQGFIGSSEFQSDYGSLSVNDFVSTLYKNVLHRASDAAGLSFWVNDLNQGASKASVLVGFSDSLENRQQTANATHANWVFIPS